MLAALVRRLLDAPSVRLHAEGGQDVPEQSPEPKMSEFQTRFIEARANALGRKIRCVVCAGQSIEDSNTDFAVVMRTVVRQKLKEGLSEKEVLNFLAETYGDDVLFSDGLSPTTIAATIGTLLTVSMGALMLYRRRSPSTATTTSSTTSHGAISRWFTPRPRVTARAMDRLVKSSYYLQPNEIEQFRALFRIPRGPH